MSSRTHTPPGRQTASRVASLVVLMVMAAALGGCLMVDRKEYVFTVRPDGSGSGRILFADISSVQESETDEDQATKDYTELVNKYIKGTAIESQNPAYQNVKKRLFEKDGRLYAELTFDFATYEDVGLYRLEGRGPWMYYVGSLTGTSVEMLDSANGTFGGSRMPVVFWPEGTTEFRLYTSLERPEEGSSVRSLLPLYKRIGTD